MMDINKMYRDFAAAVYKEGAAQQASSEQRVQALKEGFLALTQMQAETTGEQPASPAPMYDAYVPTAKVPVADAPKGAEFIAPDQQYKLVIKHVKDCNGCPFADGCKIEKSKHGDNCAVRPAKLAATAAGEISIEVEVDERSMTTSFNAYKDGLFLGFLPAMKNNNALRFELEAYAGQSVRLSTVLDMKKAPTLEYSNFTHLYAEILEVRNIGISKPEAAVTEEPAPLAIDESDLDDIKLILPY